ncbi:hypothetical protein [Novipirellula maiorica]|uniref:hypothetical protein n=1 Tax=Novipirellula maiorica TaxID=1265734 RepID=UPI0011818005|nr:hypothetical protein [Rhodopirellula maiorica]
MIATTAFYRQAKLVHVHPVLAATGGLDESMSRDLKSLLKRIMAMLTRMAMKFDGVKESSVEYPVAIDYDSRAPRC